MLKLEDMDNIPEDQAMKMMTEEGARFAEMVLGTVRKWGHLDAVKCLGLLQASIAMCKMGQFVPQETFESTVKMYWENMRLAVPDNATPEMADVAQKFEKGATNDAA